MNREPPPFAGGSAVRCRAPTDGDALDVELARRLDGLLRDTDRAADYRQSLQPVFRELAAWVLATACLLALAVFRLV